MRDSDREREVREQHSQMAIYISTYVRIYVLDCKQLARTFKKYEF